MALRMPIVEYFALRERLAGIEIVDGSPCLWQIRRVKTPAEVHHIAHICRNAIEAYEALPTKLRAGDSEREACRRLRIDLAERGADATPFMPAISGPGSVSQIVCGPHDRNYAVGPISDQARRAQDAIWLATEDGLAAAVPGATTDELWRAMSRRLEAAGSIGNNVGRLGHGLGLQLTGPPSHMLGDGTVIEVGMVLTIEPGVEYAPGKMIVHEENVVITPDGAQLLTKRAPRELWRID
jgi:Xaa-Pro dipeptidase